MSEHDRDGFQRGDRLDEEWAADFVDVPAYVPHPSSAGDHFEVVSWTVPNGDRPAGWETLCWTLTPEAAAEVARQSMRWAVRLTQVWHRGRLVREHSYLGVRVHPQLG